MLTAEQSALVGSGFFVVGLLVSRTICVRTSGLVEQIPGSAKARENVRLNPNGKLYFLCNFLMGFGGVLFLLLGLLGVIRRIQSAP